MKPLVILSQTETLSFRDPCAIWKDGICHLYYTLVYQTNLGQAFTLAESVSRDLVHFSSPRVLLPTDSRWNYSSPGNVFQYGGLYYICFQTYPRPNGETYGNQDSRLYLMHSRDLTTWSEPEIIAVKGEMPVSDMGRMIDPYILQEPDGSFLCFFKQNGVSISKSCDLKQWKYLKHTSCGENVCVFRLGSWYGILHSPANGVGLLLSRDLEHFIECGVSMLGCEMESWAKDRVTAGFLIEHEGENILFFHGDNESRYVFGASMALIRHFDLLEVFPKAKQYINQKDFGKERARKR